MTGSTESRPPNARACRLERELAGDAARYEQHEILGRAIVQHCRAKYLVYGVVATDVLGVIEERLAVRSAAA
jgi:hypothetical protein